MLLSIIRKVPLFSTLPEVELDVLAANLREYTYPAKTVLFEENDIGDRFYIVIEGGIAIVKAMGTENERLLGIRGSGEFVGEMSLLSDLGLRTASAIADQNTKTLEMTRAEFGELLQRRPVIAYEMLRVLSSRLTEAHENTIRDLMEKNRKLEEAYENLKAAQEQIIEKQILERELNRAHEIQQNMLPRTIPRLEGFDIGASMLPARAVGGDLYDIMVLDEDTIAIVVGDVSGKGVPAALFMALTQSITRAISKAGRDPDEVLAVVNRHLMEMNAGGMFITIFYGILHCKTREFVYVRAAHEYPIIWDQDGTQIPVQEDHGLPLGLFPQPVFQKQRITLPPNSTLLLFTDGVTEATDINGDFFGLDGINNSIPGCSETSAQGLCHYMVEKVSQFHGDNPQDDDITVLVVKTQ